MTDPTVISLHKTKQFTSIYLTKRQKSQYAVTQWAKSPKKQSEGMRFC